MFLCSFVVFLVKVTPPPAHFSAAERTACMAGKSLDEQGFTEEVIPPYMSVKEAVFPFVKFPGVDPILGPEMKSTGEVMGVGDTFAEAFGKATLAAGEVLPDGGKAFVSVKISDRPFVGGIGSPVNPVAIK